VRTSSTHATCCHLCSALTTLGWLPENTSYVVSAIDATEEVLEKIVEYFDRRYDLEVEDGEEGGKDVTSDLQDWDSKFLEGVDDMMLFDLVRVRH
jgi:hypothetical protein